MADLSTTFLNFFRSIVGGDFTVPSLVLNAQVGIGGTPNANAELDVQSTTKGALLPRMTTTQMNALTAVEGMEVYNTTLHKKCVYTGSAWETIVSA
jgi:hypothetical protein